jgi:uncharacterized protein with PQ loop repeat
LALIAGLSMALSPVLQLARVWRRRHSDDVSMGWVTVIILGAGTYCAYGIALNNWVLIVPNALGALISTATLLIVWRFRASTHGAEHDRLLQGDSASAESVPATATRDELRAAFAEFGKPRDTVRPAMKSEPSELTE